MKQYNLFTGEVELINKEGKVYRCEWCNKALNKVADVCSSECGKKIIEKYLG